MPNYTNYHFEVLFIRKIYHRGRRIETSITYPIRIVDTSNGELDPELALNAAIALAIDKVFVRGKKSIGSKEYMITFPSTLKEKTGFQLQHALPINEARFEYLISRNDKLKH